MPLERYKDDAQIRLRVLGFHAPGRPRRRHDRVQRQRTYSATSTNSEIYKQLDLFGDVLERVRADYVESPTTAC